MKYVQFKEFGTPDVLTVSESPTPRPKAGDVLVRVAASGVNFFEVLMRQDRYAMTPDLPMAPGVEIAGIVEAVGDDVSGVKNRAGGCRSPVCPWKDGRIFRFCRDRCGDGRDIAGRFAA